MSEEPAAMEFSPDAAALSPGALASGGGARQVTRRSRLERAQQLGAAEARLAAGEPLRQVAAALGVPRSTLRSWRTALPLAGECLPPAVASALATPAGLRWLCRLVVALQEALAEAAQAQRDALAAGMPPCEVALCVDEHYDPDVCLVAIEPVANYIVAEAYAPDRTAATWRQCLEQALAGLPVTVIQGTSDEAGALRHLVEKDFGAAHASDLCMVSMRSPRVPGCTASSSRPTRRSRPPKHTWTRSARPSGPMRRSHAIRAAGHRPSRRRLRRP
jgi:hypothetical protein